MRRFLIPLFSVLLSLTPTLKAGTPGEEAPSNQGPPVELQRLAAMIGIWDTKASYRSTPNASIVEGRSIETVRWSTNEHFVISDQHELTPNGWKDTLVITTWNPVKKEYKLINLTAAGEIVEATMMIEGNTRKILFYSPFENRLIRNEVTVEFVSDVEYKFRSECTDQEKTWVFCEGISKKRKD